jgi:hypothetical protein
MHIPSILLFPLLAATTNLDQYPTNFPKELIALRYPNADIPGHDHDLSARRARAKGIYVCNRENWQGDCWWAPANGRECQKWDNIHSFGPDVGLFCDLFEGEECKGKMAFKFVTAPGKPVVPQDGVKSWRCGSSG